MRRYPVRRSPDIPLPMSFENTTAQYRRHPAKGFLPPSRFSLQNISTDALISQGQVIFIMLAVFFGVMSSEAVGNIISFQGALYFMLFLVGWWSFVVLWRLARFIGLLAWVCSVVMTWFLVIQQNLG